MAISARQTMVGSILIGNEKETYEKLPKSEKMGASLALLSVRCYGKINSL